MDYNALNKMNYEFKNKWGKYILTSKYRIKTSKVVK